MATHVSWKLSAIVLSPGDVVEQQPKTRPSFYTDHAQPDDEGSEVFTFVCDICFISVFVCI